MVDSPFNEDSKFCFSREALISDEGPLKKLGKMGNNRDIHCYAIRGVNFEREYQPLSLGIKILVVPHVSCMPDQILGKK